MRPVAKLTTAGAALLLLAPVLLMSNRYVNFQPASWWLEDAVVPTLVLAALIPVLWIIRGLGEPDGPITSPSGLPDNAPVFRIVPAIAAFGLIFATAYITMPAALALVFGGPTTQQVTAATNISGSVDRPSPGCRHKSVIAEREDGLLGRLCYDSPEDKLRARKLGTRVVVELQGWGNGFGIYYTSTNPIGPVSP